MDPRAEWLETDGLGGFAMGTLGGPRTRRYHALLSVALSPPTRRHVLVNGFDAWVETANGRFALSAQHYAPGTIHPDGAARLVSYSNEPWPTWTFRIDEQTTIVQELCVEHGAPLAVVSWRLMMDRRSRGVAKGRRKRGAEGRATLTVRPFLTGRDEHALHHENDAFRFEATTGAGRATWQPYESLPAVTALANGTYRHDPLWYRAFLYEEERARGYGATEDCGAPGEFTWELADLPKGTAWWVVGAEIGAARRQLSGRAAASGIAQRVRSAEKRRRAKLGGPLDRAADQFVVARERGKTIVAGYPWFTDWGRDSFISLRGLCLSAGRVDDARDVLLAWSKHVSEGMLPNVFPESGSEPEYNSVDAGLWFVVAVKELLAAAGTRRVVSAADRKKLLAACEQILDGCFKGTRHGIRADVDGLLAAGVPGQQLTWMDARAWGREVTPRIGKPVEIEALWLNALAFGAAVLPGRRGWLRALATARGSFTTRFWNEARGCLNDVVDVDHVVGTADASLRPNQIFAVGGLPLQLLSGARARAVVDAVEVQLFTPRGLRTLSPDAPEYKARYEGGPDERGTAYHEGTVWPWLLGPFVEAWCRVRGDKAAVRKKAHAVFVQPLLRELAARGVVHVPELADGDAPHAWKGSPAQAWSLGEILRVLRR